MTTQLPAERRHSSGPGQGPRPAAGQVIGSKVRAWLSPRNIGAIYVLIVICIVFSIWTPSTFPVPATVTQILDDNAIIALAALALIVPLSTMTFDLSFAYVMSLSGVTAAHFVAADNLNLVLATLAGVGVALIIGVINGFVVVVMRIDSFIGTLATGSLVQAFISFVTGDNTINSEKLAGSFSNMSQGTFGGVIYPVWYALILAIALWIFMEYTATGRRLYATGFNREAARLANIKVNKLRFCSLLTSAALAGFAGVMLASSLSSGDPTAGTSYLLPAFAALFVGATVFKAGRFNAWGTIVAVLMLGTGIVGLGLVAAPLWADDMFTGVVLIAALSANVLQSRSLWMGNLRRARWMPGQLRRAEGREPAA
ncbi:MAG TPA: ABC transporter permease [Streptosporangiaceae bacterium]|nr:ABC transporter permease [Streptosporangiaceae bacterium]